MIKVTDLSGTPFYLNPDHIERIDSVPDTVITLTNGKKIMIKESPEIVIKAIIHYRRECFYVEDKWRHYRSPYDT